MSRGVVLLVLCLVCFVLNANGQFIVTKAEKGMVPVIQNSSGIYFTVNEDKITNPCTYYSIWKDDDTFKQVIDGEEVAYTLEFLQGSVGVQESVVIGRHSFIESAVRAYNNHHNLVIRPDDVWIAIMTQFGLYVNNNPEELREQFVDFKGKKNLTVHVDGTLRSVSYGMLSRMMEDEIGKYIKDPLVRKWIVPDFSTTTSSDRVVGSIVLMSTLQKYFNYGFNIGCGLPKVTLKGTVQDWEEIRSRAGYLVEYDLPRQEMKKWTAILLPVLDEFVETAKGNIDREWWSKIVTYVPFGCGQRFLSGWITVFSVYGRNGQFMGKNNNNAPHLEIDPDDIPLGYSTVPVLVTDNGRQYDTTIYAGHMAVDLQDDGHTIIPRLDWAIFLNHKNQGRESQQEEIGIQLD